jgi:hypothetical protein
MRRERDRKRETKDERDIQRKVEWFGDEGGHSPCPLWELRHLLAIVCPHEAWTRDPNRVHHRPYEDCYRITVAQEGCSPCLKLSPGFWHQMKGKNEGKTETLKEKGETLWERICDLH